MSLWGRSRPPACLPCVLLFKPHSQTTQLFLRIFRITVSFLPPWCHHLPHHQVLHSQNNPEYFFPVFKQERFRTHRTVSQFGPKLIQETTGSPTALEQTSGLLCNFHTRAAGTSYSGSVPAPRSQKSNCRQHLFCNPSPKRPAGQVFIPLIREGRDQFYLGGDGFPWARVAFTHVSPGHKIPKLTDNSYNFNDITGK